MLRRSVTALVLFASTAQTQQTSTAITPEDLRQRVSVIADDSTLGRETGSYGDDAAARYVAREFRRLGLEPSGDGGTFFQTVPIVARRFDVDATRLLAGNEALRLGRDYLPLLARGALPRGLPRALDAVDVVYGGVWADSARALDPAAARGRFVLLGVPATAGSRAGFVLFAGVPANLHDAAGIGLVVLDRLPSNYRTFLTRPMMRVDDGQRDTARVAPMILLTPDAATRLFGRSMTDAAVGSTGGKMTAHLTVIEGSTEAPARNVIAVLRGSDRARRDTYVSVSAHHDHVGYNRMPENHDSLHAYLRDYERFRQASPTLRVTDEQAASIRVNMDSVRRKGPVRPDSIYNGADDDASGTAALLEIAERLASSPTRPKRSIVFLSHTGEELGLLGSGWFSDHATVPLDSIVATMDLDMVGRGAASDLSIGAASDLSIGAPDYLELIGTRRQSTEYGDLIDAVNARRAHPFRINYAFDAHDHPEGDWCRADHYSLARYGIPAAAFSTSYHGDYHQVTDEAQYLDYPHLAAIASFVADVAVAVAELDHRPALDKPKPTDPHARCVQ
jgi:hypothetical protein